VKIFDYLYFRAYRFYLKSEKVPPELSAVALVSLMQALHILSIFLFISFLIKQKIIISKLVYVIIFLLILFFNYKKYIPKNTYNKFKLKWENDINMIKRGYLLITYVIFNLLLIFSLAICIGSHKDWLRW
jgi:hypothetical protein